MTSRAGLLRKYLLQNFDHELPQIKRSSQLGHLQLERIFKLEIQTEIPDTVIDSKSSPRGAKWLEGSSAEFRGRATLHSPPHCVSE